LKKVHAYAMIYALRMFESHHWLEEKAARMGGFYI